METYDTKKQKLIAKFKKIKTSKGIPFLEMGGGIFTPSTRKKVLGIVKQPEPGTSRNQFWYDRRNQVERALIDLQLFIELAGKDNVNHVLTRETVRPMIEALLSPYLVYGHKESELNRAEIAHLLIKTGFEYMESMKLKNIPTSSFKLIEEAIDLSVYLVELFKPESKRRYIPYTRESVVDQP